MAAVDSTRPLSNPTREGLTRDVANRALQVEFASLPSEIACIAKQCLLDWICVAVAGSREPLVGILAADCMEEGGHGAATLVGNGARVTTSQAALVNGAAGHALDFDDVHLASRVHPSAVVWPSVLAMGESLGLGGKELIGAFIAGVEAQCRIAAWMGEEHYRRGWHNTATLGSFGATLASCRLMRLSPDQACHAMGITATRAAGLRAVFGTMCKPYHAGQAAACGINAARLAARGFESRRAILECEGGFADTYGDVGKSQSPAWDGTYASRAIIFKYHASCYGTHAPIELALGLRHKFGGEPGRIAAVEVRIEPQYLSVCNIVSPRTSNEAKFSIRHAVALALAGYDTAAAASFSADAVADPILSRLRGLITVKGDMALGRARACIVATLVDGPALAAEFDASNPETDYVRQGKRLDAKFHSLLNGSLGTARCEEIISICHRFESIDDVTELFALCNLDSPQSPVSACGADALRRTN